MQAQCGCGAAIKTFSSRLALKWVKNHRHPEFNSDGGYSDTERSEPVDTEERPIVNAGGKPIIGFRKNEE